MATFAALAEVIWTQLENRPLYPLAELFANGLNPAMNLLALKNPTLLTTRIETTLSASSLFLDLRTIAPRCQAVTRVLLGRADGNQIATSLGQFLPLQRTTRQSLAALHPHWLRAVGTPRTYFMLGSTLLACWPRPAADVNLTVWCAMMPRAATLTTQTVSPELDESVHDQIADLATALLRIKEGRGDTEKAVDQIAALLGLDAEPQGTA